MILLHIVELSERILTMPIYVELKILKEKTMIITRTPFRISFFGGGTDLPVWYREHGGAVLSTTIDKYLYISCRKLPPFWDFKHRIIYGSKSEYVNKIDEIQHPSVRETFRFLNINEGLDLHYTTDLPARSGLGSSSSFTVGLLQALYAYKGKMVSKMKLALDTIHIEQNMIGEAVGSQDQVAAAFGGFNQIIFKQDDAVEVCPITIDQNRMLELNNHLVLFFTGFQRNAVDVESDKINNIRSRKLNLTGMKDMVDKGIDILNSDKPIVEFGKLLDESWQLKRNLSDKVATAYIDEIYNTALAHGAVGGKLLGAGGGGFIMFFVEPGNRLKLKQALCKLVYVPFRFENTGGQIIYYKGEEPIVDCL